MRLISNSEAQAWLKCRNYYRYSYDMALAPIKMSDALSHGILMHSALEAYYGGVKEGVSLITARMRAEAIMTQYARDSGDLIGAGVVSGWLSNYWPVAAEWDRNWEIIGVEEKPEIPVTTDFNYVFKYDLLIRDHADMGRLKLVDHKSTYNFWKEDDFSLNSQFPKYLAGLRFNKIDVYSVVVNQIRTRTLKSPTTDSLFKRTEIRYSDVAVRQALKEQILTSQEIVEYRALPEAARKNKALRIANKFNCNGCGMRTLCTAEFNGSDIEYLISSEYKRNEYDAEYNPDSVEVPEW